MCWLHTGKNTGGAEWALETEARFCLQGMGESTTTSSTRSGAEDAFELD